jgi:hypothetical protein
MKSYAFYLLEGGFTSHQLSTIITKIKPLSFIRVDLDQCFQYLSVILEEAALTIAITPK